MIAVKYIFWTIYNIWFYILVLVFTLIIILPTFVLMQLSGAPYKFFYGAGVLWSDLILFGMGMFPKKNKPLKTTKHKPYIFVANHVSMIDVMLLVSTVRNNPIVFIGKKELEKIILCDVQKEIYPNLETSFLNLLHNSGYPGIKFEKKIDFENLYNQKFN